MPTLNDLRTPFLDLSREERLAIVEKVRKNRWMASREPVQTLEEALEEFEQEEGGDISVVL